MSELTKAIKPNNIDKIKAIVNGGSGLNETDSLGYSALHLAISGKLIEVAEFLIKAKINIDLQDKKGNTALHYVAVYGQIQIAKLLLEHNADLNIEDCYGNQPLWTAVFNDKGRNERFEMIELFMARGANPHHVNKVGKSPADIVKIANYIDLAAIVK